MQAASDPTGVRTLYFVRHGQSMANAGAFAMADREIPLSALGRQQVLDLLARWALRPAQLYCSQMLRARQTAAYFAAAHGLAAQEIAELDEFSYLALATVEGKAPGDVAVLARDYWQRGDPAHRDGGVADSFDGFTARVEAFLARLHDFEDGSVFVGHGIWIGLLAWRLQGRKVNRPADMQAFRAFQTEMHVPNAGVYRLEIARGEGAARLTAMDVSAA